MTRRAGLTGGLAFLLAASAGCGGSSTAPSTPITKPSAAPVAKDDESKTVAEALAKLPPEDRKLAEEQKVCPSSGEPLGSMGKPIKLTLNGQPVFVCCDGCVKGAEKDPEGTLKKLTDLKAKEGKK